MRVLTRFGPKAGPTENEVKAAWAPNDRTVIIIVDPSSPNILDFNTGQAVEQLLRRTFFVELQSRYGNKFFVRDEVYLHPIFVPLVRHVQVKLYMLSSASMIYAGPQQPTNVMCWFTQPCCNISCLVNKCQLHLAAWHEQSHKPVMQQGEDAAILGTVGALSECLQRPGGCAVVPGIPSDQYTLTLITSLVGGVVFGYSLRLEPSGMLAKGPIK